MGINAFGLLRGLTEDVSGIQAGQADRRELERRARQDLLQERLLNAQIGDVQAQAASRRLPPRGEWTVHSDRQGTYLLNSATGEHKRIGEGTGPRAGEVGRYRSHFDPVTGEQVDTWEPGIGETPDPSTHPMIRTGQGITPRPTSPGVYAGQNAQGEPIFLPTVQRPALGTAGPGTPLRQARQRPATSGTPIPAPSIGVGGGVPRITHPSPGLTSITGVSRTGSPAVMETEAAIINADAAVRKMEDAFRASQTSAQPPSLGQTIQSGMIEKLAGHDAGTAAMQAGTPLIPGLRSEQVNFRGYANQLMHNASSLQAKGGRSMGLLQSMQASYQAAAGQDDPAVWGEFIRQAREFIDTYKRERGMPTTSRDSTRTPAPRTGARRPRIDWNAVP